MTVRYTKLLHVCKELDLLLPSASITNPYERVIVRASRGFDDQVINLFYLFIA